MISRDSVHSFLKKMDLFYQRFLAGVSRLAPVTVSRWIPLNKSRYQGQNFVYGYHSVWNNPSVTVPFIIKHGFTPSFNGNKGTGVYFANSSAYCALRSPDAPVLICGIDPDERHIQRYRAEVSDSLTDSEYVVTKPGLIHPLFLVRFQIYYPPRSTIYADYKCPRCRNRSSLAKECIVTCNCRQRPTILPEDVITMP